VVKLPVTLDEVRSMLSLDEVRSILSLDEVRSIPSLDEVRSIPSLDEVRSTFSLDEAIIPSSLDAVTGFDEKFFDVLRCVFCVVLEYFRCVDGGLNSPPGLGPPPSVQWILSVSFELGYSLVGKCAP
jgi:hypothetical protein